MHDRSSIIDIMNNMEVEGRARILSCLVDGNSIRATSRITGAAINTVINLLKDVAITFKEYQDKMLRNLPCKNIQVDEIWSFCYAKEKNVPSENKGQLGFGDVWTWTAIDAETKLVPCWLVGGRDAQYAKVFIEDLASRMANKIQLTSDGHKAYLEAVDNAFALNIDYAMLVKVYGDAPEEDRRYSGSKCVGTVKTPIAGNPDLKNASTSHVERQNLTMRMSMRRFTRLTNAFSKKLENHEHAVALHFMYYNFARIHKSLRVTPAMEAGIADHVWTLEEMVALVPKEAAKKRGPYKKKNSN